MAVRTFMNFTRCTAGVFCNQCIALCSAQDLLKACQVGDSSKAAELIAAGVDINYANKDSSNPKVCPCFYKLC